MRFRVKRILQRGGKRTGVGRKRARKEEKAKNKARGVIGSSRRGAYWGVLPEHKEPSPVFLCSMVLTCSSRLGGGFNLVFHRGTRNCPLSHAASTYDCICCCSVKICLGYGCMVPSLCNKSPAGLRITT